jgi:Uma2 family endonuclease
MAFVTTLPRGSAFTPRDLESMPDDGRRYELVDGTLPVTPTPSLRHQLVASRLTRRVGHVTLKHGRYEAAGCPTYWVVDPDEPSLIAWELEDGRYVERGHVAGRESLTLTVPFTVCISPASLLE